MPTPDPISADADIAGVQPDAQAGSDWPQLLEQWKQAQRKGLLPPASTGLVGIAALILFVAASVLSASHGHGFSALSALKILLPLFGLALMVALRLSYLPLTTTQNRLAARLNALTDVRATGPLLELLPDTRTTQERNVLQSALTNLLPQLRSADAPALSDAQRKILYDAITTHTAEHHSAFFLACMEAVAQIGDVNALVPLTHVIIADAPTHAQQVARDKARQTRDTLFARLDFGTVAAIPAWLDQLPAQNPMSVPFQLEQIALPLYALTRLLPQLTPADAPLLTPRNRQTLTYAHRMMLSLFVIQSGRGGAMGVDEAKMGRLGPDFELAALDALAQIGTGDDAAHVQTLTKDGSTAYARAVRAKAREVLPLLEARREKEQIGRTLLRGASAPPTAQDQLLRAASDAYNAQDTRPNELLRVPAPNAPPAALPIQATEEQISVRQNQSQ